MKTLRILALAALLAQILTTPSAGAPGPKAKPLKVKIVPQGEAFCPAAPLVYGNVIIQPGRCYSVLVLRDHTGAFLAFAPPGAIPPGQLVRLGTPAGAKLKGRIFYFIPIQTTAVLVPVNVLTPVAVRVEDFGPKLSITVISSPAPNVVVILGVRL
ncbi:MAG: hypothetical protein HY660_12950 [Armatimonadetes bacterium]|nr:hypothetical protein [Armatimonadota bacterium]